MKVYLDYTINDSGKGKFLKRLTPALSELGVYFDSKHGEVALGISKWRKKPKIPCVLRVDGAYFDSGKKSKWWNQEIRKSIKRSDIVVFQSEYSMSTVTKLLDIKPKHSVVIYNGANVNDYVGLPKPEGFQEHEYNILIAARWGNRKSKNLKGHLSVVRDMSDRPDIHFWLAGETDKPVVCRSNLTVLGQLSDDQLRPYQAHAKCLLYIPKWDWCSNTVIECLVAGTPVLTIKKIKGVSELVGRDGGWGVDSYDDLLSCLRDTIAQPSHLQGFCPYRFYIEKIALQYKEVFERALRR